VVKHNGPLTDRQGEPIGRYRRRGLPHAIRVHAKSQDLELWSWPSAEAQIAALADDIAYDAHDIDDGLRAGLFGLDDIATVPMIGAIVGAIRAQYPRLDTERLVHELIRRLIGRMIEDVTAHTRENLEALQPGTAADIRGAGRQVASFSPAMAEADAAIKGFLYPRMYRHPRIARIMEDAERIVRDLFERYAAHPDEMPAEWGHAAENDLHRRARHIADFIAGMTDRYALVEHARLFDSTPELR
jgi:dGTPase